MHKAPLAALLLAAALAGGCADGGNDSDAGAATAESETESSAGLDITTTTITVDESEPASPDDVAAEVPDPCTLLSNDDLSAILGSDPGRGAPNAVVPTQRRICAYESGLILAVEIAASWDASIDGLNSSGLGTVENVSGVGQEAVWQDVGGGIGQLVALGRDYFVGVTIATGGQPAATAIVTQLLDAAADA